MGKYSTLNVLNKRSFLDDLEDVNAVAQVSAMVSSAGNRSNRRRIEKALNKTVNISAHADKKATERANKAMATKAEYDMVWLFAMAGITLYTDYHWREDPSQEHGQLTSFFERMTKTMNRYNERGATVEEVAKEFEEMTGICLVPEKH